MIERFLDGLPKIEDPGDCSYMAVIMPGDMDPFERHYTFSIPLDVELRLARLGCSEGGGTLIREAEDGGPDICHCIVDIDATDIDRARALLRQHLPDLGAPAGTLLQWHDLEDRFDGESWLLAQPRSQDEFDF